MDIKKWQSLSANEQEKVVSDNEDNSTQIYSDGKADNNIPEKTHLIVYCHGTNSHGWLEITKTEQLGLEALIAQSWIKVEDLK